MAMTEQDRQKFQDNWGQLRPQVQAQFPGLTESDLGNGADPDQLAETISERTGQNKADVAKQLTSMAQQY